MEPRSALRPHQKDLAKLLEGREGAQVPIGAGRKRAAED